MTERFDISTSRTGKDGKTYWRRIGAMFPSKNGDGYAIKLDALPLPNEKGEVWLSAFPPSEREAESAPRQQSRTPAPIDDDIGF